MFRTISVQNPGICPLLSSMEPLVNSISKLRCILEMLDNCKFCDGISDMELVQRWREGASSLHGLSGNG